MCVITEPHKFAVFKPWQAFLIKIKEYHCTFYSENLYGCLTWPAKHQTGREISDDAVCCLWSTLLLCIGSDCSEEWVWRAQDWWLLLSSLSGESCTSRLLAHPNFHFEHRHLDFHVTFKSFHFNQSQRDIWLCAARALWHKRDSAPFSLLCWNVYNFISSNSSRSQTNTIPLCNSEIQSLAAFDGWWHWVAMAWKIINAFYNTHPARMGLFFCSIQKCCQAPTLTLCCSSLVHVLALQSHYHALQPLHLVQYLAQWLRGKSLVSWNHVSQQKIKLIFLFGLS